MTNSVTNRQLFFILFLTITSFTVIDIPKTMAQSAGAGSWITVLGMSLLFAVAAYILVSLNNMFYGKMLFDYSKELIGTAGAIFICIYYAQYFFTVLVDLDISMSGLLQANFLPNTPLWATSLAAIPVLGFTAYKGITNTARLIEVYGVIFLIISVTTLIIMLLSGNETYALPLFNPADIQNYIASAKQAIYPFLGLEVLAVVPFTEKNGPKAAKTAFFSLIFIGLFYVLDIESCVMLIGIDEIVHYNYPLIAAIRQVELPFLKIFQRFDLLYLTVGFLGLFAGMSMIYINIVEYVCRMLPKLNRIFVVIIVGLAVFLTEIAVQNNHSITTNLTKIITYSGVIVAGFIPVTLFILAKVKNHGKKKAA